MRLRRVHHRELHRGAQAAQAFDRHVLRTRVRQHRAQTFAAALERAFELRLFGALRHEAEHRQMERTLDMIGVVDALEHIAAQEHETRAGDQPENHRRRQDQHLLRLDRRARTQRRVDDMHVAAGARLLHRQLLHAVEQQHVDVFRDLRVALQLHGLHFGGRQIAETVRVFRALRLQLGHLFARGDQQRMVVAVALVQLRHLQTQAGDLLLVLHAAFEIHLGLVARVDRAGLALIRGQRGFRAFEIGLQARLLALQEVEHPARVFLLVRHVLAHIRLRERIGDQRRVFGVLVFQRDLDHAGLLALLLHADGRLERGDRVEVVGAHHRELLARTRDQAVDQHRHAAALRLLADLAAQQQRAVRRIKLVVLVVDHSAALSFWPSSAGVTSIESTSTLSPPHAYDVNPSHGRAG